MHKMINTLLLSIIVFNIQPSPINYNGEQSDALKYKKNTMNLDNKNNEKDIGPKRVNVRLQREEHMLDKYDNRKKIERERYNWEIR